MRLNFYYRVGCHLCDDMYEMIVPYISRHNLQINRINVDKHAELKERYGLLVPVLTDEQENEICHYFFDPINFEQLLKKND